MMKKAGLIAIAVGIHCLVSGCATQRDLDLSRYLRDLEMGDEVAARETPAGPDAPESPVSALPPPSVGGFGAGPSVGEEIPGEALTIQPDCVVLINVSEDPSLDGSYTVNSLGAVQLGYVGPVFLFNKTEREASRKIADVLRMRHFSKATVNVKILRASYDKVEISGSVNKAGLIQIGAGDSITLHDLLLRAEGIQGDATKVQVRVIREGLLSPLKYSLEGEDHVLVDEDGNPRVPDVRLRNNDVVHISMMAGSGTQGPAASELDVVGPKTILVLGEVRNKGFVTFKANEPCTMMRLLFRLGGLPPYAKSKAIRVIRRDSDGFEDEFVVNAKRIMEEGNPDDDFTLKDGDRVIVPARRISLF